MPVSPSADFDNLDDTAILDLFERVREGWQARDDEIERARQLRHHLWKPEVPGAWQQTAKIQHTALAKEIPQRVPSTLILREPVYTRTAGDDWAEKEHGDKVEKFFQAKFSWDRLNALRARDAYLVQTDNLCNKGAACVGSIYAPNAWAGAPLFLDTETGQPLMKWWRDSSGRETDNDKSMDLEATSRAFMRGVDGHRQRAGSILKRRIVPTETAYPLIVEDELIALFILRRSSMMELDGRGFVLDTGNLMTNPSRSGDFLEVVTRNRIRYYLDRNPVRMTATAGMTKPESDGSLYHGSGFVPYVYRVGMDSGEAEWGRWGSPLLMLIESNLKTITALRTYLMNAVHLASFTSFWLEYIDRGNGGGLANVVDAANGRKLTTFEFKSGTIMDFGPDRKVNPFTHPGLNNDFYKLLEAEREEIDRIIPRAMVGMDGSSGFDTVQKTTNARALLESLQSAQELLEMEVATMDMRHIHRHPGPVYMTHEVRGNAGKKIRTRVRLEASDLDDDFEIAVGIDRTLDYMTEGQWALNMLAGGIGDKEWVAGKAGITDYAEMMKRQARDRFLDSPAMQQIREQEAIRVYGLEEAQERAAAMAQITQMPDGTMAVVTPNGPVAPGLPRAQAGAGNAEAVAQRGLANLDSTANPRINTPGNNGVPRSRRRGGATPGAPQMQPARSQSQAVAA